MGSFAHQNASSFLLMNATLLVSLYCAVASRELTVGGDKGWVVGVVNYTQWASNYTFYVGDFLVFNYLQEFHNVLEVTNASYANCGVSNFIDEYKDGKTTIQLKEARPYYFICGVRMHCPLGQKLEVLALQKPSEAPAPSPNHFQPSSPSLPPSPYALSSCFNPTFCAFFNLTLLLFSLLMLFDDLS